ncbi:MULTISPECIES: SRPBCC family protein [unclassified Aeromicrobium]|uniref:SRPBCC family protein n=1 Tax=unclassified Aeromicrobium TaxID=2633570 RepID=UPI00288ACA8F|nr:MULTISPECIES: SRPBCC family protein [unclassified Aeromicrobium]
MDTHITATRAIDAPAGEVFAILSDPQRHHEIDGSDMVRSDDRSDRITAAGQSFRMNMHHPRAGDYQTDNHVTGFEQGSLLAWQTGAVDADPAGWEWVWRLTPLGRDSTEVSVTYDWSKVSDPAVLKRLHFPVVPHEALESTLANLAAAVA